MCTGGLIQFCFCTLGSKTLDIQPEVLSTILLSFFCSNNYFSLCFFIKCCLKLNSDVTRFLFTHKNQGHVYGNVESFSVCFASFRSHFTYVVFLSGHLASVVVVLFYLSSLVMLCLCRHFVAILHLRVILCFF